MEISIVYLVETSIEYEPALFHGIFSTKEKAEEIKNKHPNAEIYEIILDKKYNG